MATVTVFFDGGDVPVLKGARKPSADNVPITNPITVGTTNTPFFAVAGVHLYALDTTIAHMPLWQRARAIEGVPQELTFKKIVNAEEMG
jgi:hypothetical protein